MASRMEGARAAVPFALVPILALTLMGCGGGGGPTPAPPTPAPPTPPPTPAPTPAPPAGSGCLCIFDIDRTLTGDQKQSNTDPCTKNTPKPGIHDPAYAQGDLVLSELGANIQTSGCKECYIGVISAGGPSTPEKAELFKHLTANGKMPEGVTNDQMWNTCKGGTGTPNAPVTGPFITLCADGQKQDAVPAIKEWYGTHKINVDDEKVYFFDDRISNVDPFGKDKPYNAKQISCASRDKAHNNEIGFCGAALSEITLETGKKTCAAETRSEEIV